MAKKPTFITPETPDSNRSDANDKGPAPTRLYRDPADAPASSANASGATRIVGAEPPAEPKTSSPAGSATRLVTPPAPAPTVTRVLEQVPQPGIPEDPPVEGGQPKETKPVVGWVVVVDGPGRGEAMPFHAGMNAIGSGEDNDVVLNHGDRDITAEPHAFIVYDKEGRTFHVTHAGQNALVRLNDKPLLEATEVNNGTSLRIGETTLRIATFCGPDFDWSDS